MGTGVHESYRLGILSPATRRGGPQRPGDHRASATHRGVVGFASPDNDAPASSPHLGQGQRQLRVSAAAVPSSNLMQAIAMLEAIVIAQIIWRVSAR